MEQRSIFASLSPLDHRYYLANRELFEKLGGFLSEEANVAFCLEAEIALLTVHARRLYGEDAKALVDAGALRQKVTVELVYEEEERTHHNIRALVNVMKRFVPEKINPYVHLGATSVDILDTAMSLRVGGAVREVVLPLLWELEERLAVLAEKEAETPQVGRTHGQHAVPVTFGFAMAEYAARLGKSLLEMEKRCGDLRGKLAGAVGAYNATSLLVDDPQALEREYLQELGLEPAEYATQMVEPEYMLRLLLEINTAFGIIANLADDLRHLQRSEIDEVREFFSSTQVGSSTMPQKRNPWNSEHVKSLWKAFSPRVVTFFMDQISEHQRDLSNSASGRFVADYIAGFCAAAERMNRIIESLYVDRQQMRKNLDMGGDMVLAEAAYILLALEGDSDAHEAVRKATLLCEKEKISLKEALARNEKLWDLLDRGLRDSLGLDADTFFSDSARYRGKAAEKAVKIGRRYRELAAKRREK
ncbi:lyase family protein [Sediminispirochaeta bajacaliforniensis]|uniref:lyase family protein n=1 Tax=Sediminispirochaeta bajacaliforniensis TaxID=148 RepID=UPI000379D891|nr:lyase family protein [Sediminispirochaeta bajacaliforniensis]